MSAPLFVAVDTQSGSNLTTAVLAELKRDLAIAGTVDWHRVEGEGIAFLAPEIVTRSRPEAVLAIRGRVLTPGRAAPPAGYPELEPAEGPDRVLYDLLERDTAALSDLRGQFAAAWWDGRRRRLGLARDHLGQRALFVREVGPSLLLFSSELDVLLRLRGRSVELDFTSAHHYLCYGRAAPERTLARGVHQLPAAHCFFYEPGGPLTRSRYWTPLSQGAPRGADAENVARIRAALDRSTLRAAHGVDSLGLLLSGGVDSTLLAATLARAGKRPVALTVEFDERYGMNETDYAAGVAGALRFEHQVVPITSERALRTLHEDVLAEPVPAAAWAAISQFEMMRRASGCGVARVLSGLGSDEIFGGYDHFRGYYVRLLRFGRRHPTLSPSQVFELMLSSESPFARSGLYPGVARFFDDHLLPRALHAPYDAWSHVSRQREFYRECLRLKPAAEPMELMVAHECQWRIPDVLLAGFDVIARRCGVEPVYPFLDPDVVTAACALSVESRYRTKSGTFSTRLSELLPGYKYTLMKVAEDRVPPAILERVRKSLTAPFGGWLYDPAFGPSVLGALRDSRLWQVGLVKRDWLDVVLRKAVPGPNRWVFQLWALLTLGAWIDRWVT